ncbi:hypothetical protein ACLBYD_25660 [Rhodococcus sp. C26F]
MSTQFDTMPITHSTRITRPMPTGAFALSDHLTSRAYLPPRNPLREGAVCVTSFVYRSRTAGGVAWPGLAAASHAVLDALHGASAKASDGRVCDDAAVFIVQSGATGATVDDVRHLVYSHGARSLFSSRAVGLVVSGRDPRESAADLAALKRSIREMGAYVVGGGMVLDEKTVDVDLGSTGPRFRDVALASSLSLLGRRVATLARAGRTLRVC